jgi:hypothetical protein
VSGTNDEFLTHPSPFGYLINVTAKSISGSFEQLDPRPWNGPQGGAAILRHAPESFTDRASLSIRVETASFGCRLGIEITAKEFTIARPADELKNDP